MRFRPSCQDHGDHRNRSRDPYGGTRAGFSASGQISRKDFGIEFNIPMDGGGVVIGDKIQIHLEIEAVLQS